MDWTILGIGPTKDTKAITAAYRQKLRQTNPEDKPEEFKALRAAYEEAMALADREEPELPVDDSPVGRWMAQVTELYQDFAGRIDPARWEALLGSDVCIGLDTRGNAEEALLKFLMEFYYLPREVWQALDNTFHFTQRAEELYESWPREFVDHAILSGVRMEPSLPYGLFTPGVSGSDCDAYRQLVFQANQTASEELKPLLDQMDALSETHPYGEAIKARYLMAAGEEAAGRALLHTLARRYENDTHLTLLWANVCMDAGDAEETERLCRRILERNPGHIQAGNLLARCMAGRGRYTEAKELCYDLMHGCGGDPITIEMLASQMRKWNDALISQREERYAQAPDDAENAIELAWCYSQNERLEDALALARKIDPEQADAFEYHNLMGKLYHNTQHYEESLPHLEIVEDLIRGMTDDGTDKTARRMRRLPEMLQIHGYALMQLGRTAEARERFEQALELAPEEPEVLMIMGKILCAGGDYSEAVQVLQRLLRVSPLAWYAEVLLAMAFYKLERDPEAFDAINRAMAIQGGDLSVYIIKMLILVRNGVWDEVRDTLRFLEESGAPQDIALDYIRAMLTELEAKDEKKALEQYRALDRRMEQGENLLFPEELYYRMAILTGNGMELRREEDRRTVLDIIDKGLEHEAHDPDCLAYKAWVLRRGGLTQEAMAIYKEMEARDPDSLYALRGMAELYYEDLNRNAADALAYYERLLRHHQTPDLYFYAATCRRYLGDGEGAKADYLRELEMDPADIDALRGLAFLREAEGDYAESLKLLDQALEIMDADSRRLDWLIGHKAKILRRMGRGLDALSFIDEAAQRFGFDGGPAMKFEICCQFGFWDLAEQTLAEWKRADRNDPERMAAEGKLHLLRGRMFRAALAMGPAKHKLPYERVQDFRLLLAELECNFDRQIQIWQRRVKENPEDDYAMTNLAQACWHGGKYEQAREAARKAIELLDRILSGSLMDEALYRSRRSLSLAILGLEAEARAELAKVRSLPLCDFCDYGSCKDADIYEAAIEEILGYFDRAAELWRTGRAKWPDDTDFAAGEARLKRKGKKKC